MDIIQEPIALTLEEQDRLFRSEKPIKSKSFSEIQKMWGSRGITNNVGSLESEEIKTIGGIIKEWPMNSFNVPSIFEASPFFSLMPKRKGATKTVNNKELPVWYNGVKIIHSGPIISTIHEDYFLAALEFHRNIKAGDRVTVPLINIIKMAGKSRGRSTYEQASRCFLEMFDIRLNIEFNGTKFGGSFMFGKVDENDWLLDYTLNHYMPEVFYLSSHQRMEMRQDLSSPLEKKIYGATCLHKCSEREPYMLHIPRFQELIGSTGDARFFKPKFKAALDKVADRYSKDGILLEAKFVKPYTCHLVKKKLSTSTIQIK